MTDDVKALIAEARRLAATLDPGDDPAYITVHRLADALEAATASPAVDREALVNVLNSPEHAPMSDHDPRDGSCRSCPWPVHMLAADDIADHLFASLDWRDVRDVQAEQRERDAQIADSIGHQENNRYSHIAWEVAQAIREARPGSPDSETGEQ